MANLVVKRYAKALFNSDKVDIKEAFEALNSFNDAINGSSEIKEFINSPLVSNSKKAELIDSAFSGKIDNEILSLLKLMALKGRLPLIADLVNELKEQIQKEENNYKGIVVSKDKLDSSLIEKLEKALSKYSNSNITLEYQEDAINGIKAEVADLGLELNFSKERVKNSIIEHINKAL